MEKIVDEKCINMFVIPLTEDQCMSLEDFLHENIVESRQRDEFVVVVGDEEMSFPTLVSYGLNEGEVEDKSTRQEVERLVKSLGAQWMKDNGLISLH
jgi:hypothetical protein